MAKVGGYWQESYLFTLTKKGGSDVEFAAKTEEVKLGGAARGVDLKTLINGGNLVQFKPMDMWTVDAKIYPTDIAAADQLFFGSTTDVTQPLSVTNVLTRYEMRAAIMFTDDTAATSATQATAASSAGYRISAIGGFITKAEHDLSNKDLALNVTIEFPPYTAAAVGNLKRESTDTTAVLPALGAYT